MAFRLIFQRFWVLFSILLCQLELTLSNEGSSASQQHMSNDRPRPQNVQTLSYNGYERYKYLDEEPKNNEETKLVLDMPENLATNLIDATKQRTVKRSRTKRNVIFSKDTKMKALDHLETMARLFIVQDWKAKLNNANAMKWDDNEQRGLDVLELWAQAMLHPSNAPKLDYKKAALKPIAEKDKRDGLNRVNELIKALTRVEPKHIKAHRRSRHIRHLH